MKKGLLLSFVVALFCLSSNAQKTFTRLEKTKASNTLNNHAWDLNLMNEQIQMNEHIPADFKSPGSKSDVEIDPFKVFTKAFGFFYDVDLKTNVLYLREDIRSGVNILSTTITILDADLNEEKSFELTFPSKTNDVKIIEGFNSSKYITLMQHNTTPDYVGYNSIWVVDVNTGEKVKEFNNMVFAQIKGGKIILSSAQYLDQNKLVFCNAETFEQEFEIKDDPMLLTGYYGLPTFFTTIDDVPYICVAHYEKQFADLNLNLTPNNNFIIKVYNYNYELVTEIKIKVPNKEDLPENVLPIFDFGTFIGQKYNISKSIYNDDDKFEILYVIHYFDKITQAEWFQYNVADEEGNLLLKYTGVNKNTTDIALPVKLVQMNQSIPGFDDQAAFIAVDLVGGNQKMHFVNLRTMEIEADFLAYHLGEQISEYFNRIRKGDSYEYVFSMADIITVKAGEEKEGEVAEQSYGVIKTFEKENLTQTGEVKLDLGLRAISFVPNLENPIALDPHLINTDDEQEYFYLVQDFVWETVNGKLQKSINDNHVYVAQNGKKPIFHVTKDTIDLKLDQVAAAGLLNNIYHKNYLYVSYMTASKYNGFVFYSLPFDDVNNSVEENKITETLLARYNQFANTITVDAALASAAVYTINGTLVYAGSEKEISTTGWTNGIYLVKMLNKANQPFYQKIMVY